jgi:large subunit ribosomal protein L15
MEKKKSVKSLKQPARPPRPAKSKKVQPKEKAVTRQGLHNLPVPQGAHRPRRILGRGPGSGHGKTATRGSKGQTSRAGRHFYAGFEGGQSPLIRRMPKRGFTSPSKTIYQIVNLEILNKIKESSVTPESLQKAGLIKDSDARVKILGDGEIKQALSVKAHAFSRKAAEKIQQAGGKVETIK